MNDDESGSVREPGLCERVAESTAVLGSAPSRVEVEAQLVPDEPLLANLSADPPANASHGSVTLHIPGSSTRPTPSLASRGPSLSIVTPEQGMQIFAARRAWTFAVALSVLCAGAVVIVAWIGGDPLGQKIHIAGISGTGLVAAAYAVRYRNPERFNPIMVVALVYVSMFANATGYIYWGVFSAYFGIISVTAYAFASGATQRHVIQVTVVASALHLGIGGALLSRWIIPNGLLVPASNFSPVAQIVVLILLQIVLLGAVWGGLDSQAKMRTVLDEHNAAMRELSQREAQLAEAHEAVRDARRVNEGRY
ncbi:MAG: hypothetical protein KBG15_20380, partial [Kofleriaceae bacterium]|nr:hypothetical protein [Kofleriaceae bacterium]